MDARIHLHLRTPDLARARTFYQALLGAPDKVRDDIIRFQPEGVALSLTLMQGQAPELGPDEHFGIKWSSAEATQQAWERISQAGLEAASEEGEVSCCAAVQTKRWFVDPDGRPWEVYAVLDDSDAVPTFPARPPQAASSEVCCGSPAPSTGCCG